MGFLFNPVRELWSLSFSLFIISPKKNKLLRKNSFSTTPTSFQLKKKKKMWAFSAVGCFLKSISRTKVNLEEASLDYSETLLALFNSIQDWVVQPPLSLTYTMIVTSLVAPPTCAPRTMLHQSYLVATFWLSVASCSVSDQNVSPGAKPVYLEWEDALLHQKAKRKLCAW